MAKLTLTDLTTLAGSAALTAINANFTAIETAVENTYSRDGTSPNQLTADLDMNSNNLLNLPYPASDTEPVRLGDIDDLLPTFFSQNSAPDTTENAGSLWIDADSTDLDVYQLVASVWTDTGINLKGATGATGATGAAGTNGTNGTNGTSVGVDFTYSTTTTDSDPGAGIFRLNNATISSATEAYIDNTDVDGNTITGWLDSFDDSTNTTVQGVLYIRGVTDPTDFAVFNVTSTVVDGTGYRKLTLSHLASGGTWTNAQRFSMNFSPAGDKGADGAGTGDVVGPASSTDLAIARFDSTTGKLLQDSVVLIDDTTGTTYPAANDSGALGKSGTAWGDLFLASGGVINWNAGNATITHSAGLLQIGVTRLELTSSGPTVTFDESDGGANARYWDFVANGGIFYGRVLSDAYASPVSWIEITRSAASITQVDVMGEVRVTSTATSPVASDGNALGTTSLMWSDLFLASGSVINFNNGDMTITHAAETLTFGGDSSTGKVAFSCALSETPVALTDGATPALDASLGNVFTLSAAGNRTIAVPTNATDGQKIVIRHFASGADRTLALNTGAGGFNFGTDITGLTATTSGTYDYIGCIYNSTLALWDVVAYAKGYS